jgi:diacylglycerol kinase (ATP)
MEIKKHTGISRILHAGLNSYTGLRHNFIHEAAIRQEIIAAMIMIPFACWLDVSTSERLLMICAVLLVIIVELLNTAIEATVDRIGLDYHELSGLAKDTGSAAVFFSLLLCTIVWLTIVIPLLDLQALSLL